MDIEIAKYSGYCFGVKRALNITEGTLNKYKKKGNKIYTLGQIIHNNGVVERLSKKGITIVNNEENIMPGSVLIVRSHGMSPVVLKRIRAKKVKIVDATCPFVKKAQAKAKFLSQSGYFVIIIGNKDHPEVKGIKEHIKDNNFMVIEDAKDIEKIGEKEKIGVVVQTTQTIKKLKSIMEKILENGKEILVENTICSTTKNRQKSTEELAKRVDIMIIVGGKNSANTTHLAEISKNCNTKTYHVENYKEINLSWLRGAKKVGISGGASTPKKDILKIKKLIEKL